MTNLNSKVITSHSSWNPAIPFERRKKNQNLTLWYILVSPKQLGLDVGHLQTMWIGFWVFLTPPLPKHRSIYYNMDHF